MYLLDALVDKEPWVAGLHRFLDPGLAFLIGNVVVPGGQGDGDRMGEIAGDGMADWDLTFLSGDGRHGLGGEAQSAG